jgi:hypothetical protein
VQYKVAARVPRKPVWYIPHHVSPAVTQYRRITQDEARRQLGLPASEIIVNASGFITYAKRIPMLLGALSMLHNRVPPFRLVLAGEKCPEQYDVDADIANAGLRGCTTVTGYLDEPEFFKHLAASDVVANLRHPTGGEMSGTLIRALGMGVPTIVFDIGPMGEFPSTVVRKIAWEGDTQANLAQALYELISDRARRQDLGARASTYVRETQSIEKNAGRYAKIVRSGATSVGAVGVEPIREYFPHPKVVASRIRRTGGAPQTVDGRFWWQGAKVPLGQPGRRALILAPHPERTAVFFAEAFAWHLGDLTAMTLDEFLAPQLRDEDGTPIPQDNFTFALVIASADLPEISAAALLQRLNAALRRGGNLTIEIWSAIERENGDAPFAETRMVDRLVDAGFADAWRVSSRDVLLADLVSVMPNNAEALRFACFTARKASTLALWRFKVELQGKPNFYGGRIG